MKNTKNKHTTKSKSKSNHIQMRFHSGEATKKASTLAITLGGVVHVLNGRQARSLYAGLKRSFGG